MEVTSTSELQQTRTAMNVLVVDDEPDITDVISMILAIDGHRCRQAHSGYEALAIATTFTPDIVVLDIGLPDLSGYEVARELRRRLGRRPYLVALTGWGQPADCARAVAAEFDQHVLKPVTRAGLCELVKNASRR